MNTVRCPSCHEENPADFRFCGKCGGKLIQYCLTCGSENPLLLQFCGKCGASLLEKQPPKKEQSQVSGPAKILVVDDEPYITKLVKHLLESEGMQVEVAGNAKEAADLVAKFHPSVLITDRMMPDMDGFELIKLLRRNTEFSQMKIIMLTVVDTFDDIRRSILVGADDYIRKPFDPQELIWSVKRQLKKFHPWEEKNKPE
jgi:CheY-like chemotaxis protein/ribosomal protein L40E